MEPSELQNNEFRLEETMARVTNLSPTLVLLSIAPKIADYSTIIDDIVTIG